MEAEKKMWEETLEQVCMFVFVHWLQPRSWSAT
jgi:hypothetical protein